MKKKIQIGSLIAVVVLTLVSFTSVVGFQSVKSDSKISSPLFGLRTKRAFNNDNSIIRSDYIRKDEDNNILFPNRYQKSQIIQLLSDYIDDMDYETYNRFLKLITSSKIDMNSIEDEQLQELLPILNFIENNVDSFNPTKTGSLFTYTVPGCGGVCEYPILRVLLSLLAGLLFIIIYIITSFIFVI